MFIAVMRVLRPLRRASMAAEAIVEVGFDARVVVEWGNETLVLC